MKGYCKCGKVIDEVEFSQLGMCHSCYHKECRGIFGLILSIIIFTLIAGGFSSLLGVVLNA